MLQEKNIVIELKWQQHVRKTYMRNLKGTESILRLESKQSLTDVSCAAHDADASRTSSGAERQELFHGSYYTYMLYPLWWPDVLIIFLASCPKRNKIRQS